MHRVFEMVRREAERHGCRIVGSEIVGLVPKKALEMAADFFLQFENFKPEIVLENRFGRRARGENLPASGEGKLAALATPLLDAVSAATPTPGGGSVAALAGALAASLGQMVAGLARKKKSYAQYAEQLSAAVSELNSNAQGLAGAMDRDAASYDAVMNAYKLPKESPQDEARRAVAIDQALRGAAEVPMEVAETAVKLHGRLGQLEGITPASMKSDIQVGKLMATAAALGALANVEINLESITDAAFLAAMKRRVAAVQATLAPHPAAAIGKAN